MAFEEDIGSILFRDILGFFEYPGSPFTSNIVTDLIMFFLVPTTFIILVIYMMVGRILPHEMHKLRILLGVTAYLFIVAGGYYRNFALIAGPYFIFLIFIMGLLYFFIEHFTGRRTQQAGPTGQQLRALGAEYSQIADMDLAQLRVEAERVAKALNRREHEYSRLENQVIEQMNKGRDARVFQMRLDTAGRERDELLKLQRAIQHQIEDLTVRGKMKKAAERFKGPF